MSLRLERYRTRKAIERRLPPDLRGTGIGYQRLLGTVPLRISVSGVRGKSSCARIAHEALSRRIQGRVVTKITGTDPVVLRDEAELPLEREGPVMLDETLWTVKAQSPMDALVIENQAITPYTMRVVHEELVQPHYVLVTNLRRDHQSTLAPDREGIAQVMADSIPDGARVLLGEVDADVAASFVAAASPRIRDIEHVTDPDLPDVPGAENILLVNRLMERVSGEGLDEGEKRRALARLEDAMRWRPTRWASSQWFPGGEANDVDSTQMLVDWLQKQHPGPITFVAYFRDDRRGRREAFTRFLLHAFQAKFAADAYVAGPGSEFVARKLRNEGWPVQVVHDNRKSARELASHLGPTSARIMTIANAVAPWAREFAKSISPASPAKGA